MNQDLSTLLHLVIIALTSQIIVFFLFAGVASGCLRLSENLNLGGLTSYNGKRKELIINVEAAGQKMYGWVGYGPYLARSQVCG